jgi:hypothetical protein
LLAKKIAVKKQDAVNFPSSNGSKQFRPVGKQDSESMKISGWDCDFDLGQNFL